MRTVHHPTIPDVSRSVPTDAVKDWTDQGWLTRRPTHTTAAETRADEASKEKKGNKS